MNFEEDDKEDYFNENAVVPEPEKPKGPKPKPLKPDDPAYWDRDETEFEHLKPEHGNRIYWWVALAGIVIGLLTAGYIYWFAPYAVNAVQYGYVEDIEQRGLVFKSYEGTLLPYKNIMDTSRVYQGDFLFSTKNTDAAVTLRRMQYANRPVMVVYRKYRSIVPWRGDTKYIIDSVVPADPNKILPPDRQPRLE